MFFLVKPAIADWSSRNVLASIILEKRATTTLRNSITSTQCLELSGLQTLSVEVFYGKFFLDYQLLSPIGTLLTATSCTGRSPGDSRNSKKLDNANVYGQSIQLLRRLIEHWLSRALRRRLWRDGRLRCRLSKRCCPKTNIRFLIGRRKSIGKAFTVGWHRLIWIMCQMLMTL